jgi:hypothetical protein
VSEAASTSGTAVVPPPTPKRGRSAPAAAPRTPTPSEVAVHVREDVSKIFVIVSVLAFVAILLNGIVLGSGGLLTTTPSPTASPSPTPSASASPAASPSASPTTAPSP